MKLIPASLSRTLAEKALLTRKHSPTILFGTGVVSMVGSTVLACRATLKLESVLTTIERDKELIHSAKLLVDEDQANGAKYSDAEVENDLRLTGIQGIVKVGRLYAPAVGLGVLGIVCLTKSHRILEERNVALTAAYVAVDKAFSKYRERVVDRFGEDTDRELRYGYEDVDLIDDTTGKSVSVSRAEEGDPGMYARWFDADSSTSWSRPHLEEYNWVFLRQQQNWANDMLHSRGYLFLNEVYGMIGLSHTSAGQIVGWIYEREGEGDGFVDFQCWDQKDNPLQFNNGREGSILLDFNVDGPIWDLIEKRK